MNKITARILATIACLLIFALYIAIVSYCDFKHGGGTLVMVIAFSMMAIVWNAITHLAKGSKKGEKEDLPLGEKPILPKDNPSEVHSSEPPATTSTVNTPLSTDLPPIPEAPFSNSASTPSTSNLYPTPIKETKCVGQEEVSKDHSTRKQRNDSSNFVQLKNRMSRCLHQTYTTVAGTMKQLCRRQKHNKQHPTQTADTADVFIVIWGSIILTFAIGCMIVSAVEFQSIWTYAADRFHQANWFAQTSWACSLEIALWISFSVVATILITIQYAIFRHAQEKYIGVIWGTIEIVIGFCTLPAILSSIMAIVIGCIYIVRSIKKLGE